MLLTVALQEVKDGCPLITGKVQSGHPHSLALVRQQQAARPAQHRRAPAATCKVSTSLCFALRLW
jgi:hypothetical protein